MTPAENKARFIQLQHELRPIREDEIRIHLELRELTMQIALDELRAAFPAIVIEETLYPRVENRTEQDSTPVIIRGLQQGGVTPKTAVVDRHRLTISFIV